MDGFQWSAGDIVAGIRFKIEENGEVRDIIGGDPVISKDEDGELLIQWGTIDPSGAIEISMEESGIEIEVKGKELKNWFLEFLWAEDKQIPVRNIQDQEIGYSYKGHDYFFSALSGSFSVGEQPGLKIVPKRGRVELELGR
jgi:hypothetical protein